jgi:spore germination cell wall hydrolase CwlJ-like protein
LRGAGNDDSASLVQPSDPNGRADRPVYEPRSLDWLIAPPVANGTRARRRHLLWIVVGAAILGITVAHWYVWPASSRIDPSDAARLAQQRAAATRYLRTPFAPAALRPLRPEQAQRWNAAIPTIEGPNPAASAFVQGAPGASTIERSTECLTAAIYYEAGSETADGQRAVAQVVLNRVRHPAYPHSVCGVVFQGADRHLGCQFSFACDGSLARHPAAAGWARARLIAEAALGGFVYAGVGWATHYHADYVVPYWASSLVKVTTIGAHIFYRWTGALGARRWW